MFSKNWGFLGLNLSDPKLHQSNSNTYQRQKIFLFYKIYIEKPSRRVFRWAQFLRFSLKFLTPSSVISMHLKLLCYFLITRYLANVRSIVSSQVIPFNICFRPSSLIFRFKEKLKWMSFNETSFFKQSFKFCKARPSILIHLNQR